MQLVWVIFPYHLGQMDYKLYHKQDYLGELC